uniref:HEAT repeat-containing protein 1 n=2 Tax=Ditylenchus dipsaci TaxID=166011 RepID=A0A915DLG9_9BILA
MEGEEMWRSEKRRDKRIIIDISKNGDLEGGKMTSLELQLKKLKTPATQSLAVNRDCSSLLFDSRQAASYGRQEFYDIGINGLSQLQKFDLQFEEYEPQLFDKTTVNFNRTMLEQDDHNELNAALERMIIRLAPYFHQQACKQVLEWLIYKYQIHRFNAEFLFTALLPYHSSNSFGRLLSILKFNKPEWNFVAEFAKPASPIPINVLIRVCLANRSYFLVPVLANFLMNAIKAVGEEYAEKRLHPNFTFFTNFMLHLFEDSSRVDDQLIARVLPFVGIALKSKVFAFKCAGLTIVAKIMISTSLTPEVLNNILKLVLLKVREPVMDVILDTVVLVCQTQKVASLPRKAILKLVRKREELGLLPKIQNIRETFELTSFLVAFWEALLSSLIIETDKDFQTEISSVLIETLDLERMDGNKQHVRAIAIRFSGVFDAVRAQWLVRDKCLVDMLMKECRIETHEVGEVVVEFSSAKSKKRRRRTSSTASTKLLDTSYQDPSLVSIIQPNPEDKITPQEKMQKARDEVAPQRSPYKKPVLKLLQLVKADSEHSELEWALESLSLPLYLKKQLTEDLEEFFVQCVLQASQADTVPCKSKLKVALAQIALDPEIVLVLLSEQQRSPRKRDSLAVKSKKDKIAGVFVDETPIQQEKRLVFMLEVLNISVANFSKATPELVKRLFDLVEKAQPLSNSWLATGTTDRIYFQQLCLSLLGRVLEPAGAAKLLFSDNTMLDPLVKVIRFTQAPVVLRKALKVLTLVAPIIPAQAVSQFMSLFTFMGDGVLKRDNELTLTVFEETLNALFGALLASDGKHKEVDETFQRKILEISRMLTLSLMDIPAHRRIRILRAVSQQIPHECLWIVLGVLFEDFCIRWEKAKGKRQEKIENLDDISLELVSELQLEHQLEVVISLLDYIVRLGGDIAPTNGRAKPTPVVIFDRSLHEIRKLRHFRFVIMGFVNKCLNNKILYDKSRMLLLPAFLRQAKILF